MIPARVLYSYPFFSGLDSDRLKSVAEIAREETMPEGVIIFQEGQPAETLYFLKEGSVALYYSGDGENDGSSKDGIPVGEINPGEPFSISALIEPHILTTTARSSRPCRVIKIEAKALQGLFKTDRRLAYLLTHEAAKAAIERLLTTRIQLAAARA